MEIYETSVTSLVVQWLRFELPMQGAQVQSLNGELRSHMTHSMAKKLKIKKRPQLRVSAPER